MGGPADCAVGCSAVVLLGAPGNSAAVGAAAVELGVLLGCCWEGCCWGAAGVLLGGVLLGLGARG